MNCQWLPYLNRCRCGWKEPSESLIPYRPIAAKKREIEKHLGRPVNKLEIIEEKVSTYL